MMIGSLILAGLFMYRLAYWFTESKAASILAGMAYIASPYYVVVVSRLGNLCETLALALIPAVVYYSIQRFYHPDDNKNLALCALLWYLLITVHLVSFIYTSLFVGLLLLFFALQNKSLWRNLINVGIAYCFSLMLAAWFLAPVAAEQHYFMLSETYFTGATLHYFHPILSHLLSPAALTSPHFASALYRLHPDIGWPILLAAGICIYGFFNQMKTGNSKADRLLPLFIVLFALAFFMAWSPIDFWQWLPAPLLIAQYSWRLLSQVTWIGSLLFAWAVLMLYQQRMDLKLVVMGTFLIFIASSSWQPEIKYTSIKLDEFIKQPKLVYNENAYAINFSKNTQFVTDIDSMLIEPNQQIKWNAPYLIYKEFFAVGNSPHIEVTANIDKESTNQELVATVNGTTIATKKLTPGKLAWNFTLPSTFITMKNKQVQLLQFDLRNTINQHSEALTSKTLKLDQILLTGFLNPTEILNVKQVEPTCQHIRSSTICKIDVPKNISLIELPALYYPNLIHITINGKTVSPHGVMYKGYLLTGVNPIPGITNTIKVEFRGIAWANWVSLMAWGIWILTFAVGLRSRR